MKQVKCKGCFKTGTFRPLKTKEWHWCSCIRCGFHTSSYSTAEKAKQAARDGEHYLSEEGNRFPETEES